VIEFIHEGKLIKELLYLIWVMMNEQFEVQSGGARLGENGEIVIATENVNEGDEMYEHALSIVRSE